MDPVSDPAARRPRPRGLIFDYGGTLVDEVRYDARAGLAVLLAHAVPPPSPEQIHEVETRADRVMRDVAGRRDEWHIETPWPALSRLIHHAFGIGFTRDWPQLELVFWDAAVTTVPTPGVHDALRTFRAAGLPMAVLSNSSFGSHVIRHELAKHGLAGFFDAVIVSADYAVRKPNPLLFDVAAARLGIAAADLWFVGDRLDTDVAGAKAAGMTAVWYARGSSDDTSDAHIRVSSWAGLTAEAIAPAPGCKA